MVAFTIALLACGGKPGQVNVDPGPVAAFNQFMRAVADSNLNRMAELWGTAKGPASETHPADYQRRIAIMWAYLRNAKATVVAEVERTSDRSVLAVDMARANCTRRVPTTMVRVGSGQWLVESLDIALLGAPGAPCPSEQRSQPPP
jgi:hypothetical protein